MPIEIPFHKATGAGNDFVLIDNMTGWLHTEKSALARVLCDRHFGIGADGLVVLEPAKRADFTMLYYNADGSFGGMCGNGGRCAALFAHKAGYSASSFSFRALAHTYRGTVTGDNVSIHMKNVSRIRGPRRIDLGSLGEWEYYKIDTGAPHIVCFCRNLSAIPVATIGRLLREHVAFAPVGTNVNFASLCRGHSVAMRTYERGVEAETLACGTGAIATALAAHQVFGVKSVVGVKTRSKQLLCVEFNQSGSYYSKIILSGEARILLDGRCLYAARSRKIYV
jgi:diaminopimelate epimerase